MASKAQKIANKKNAQHSTGPRTLEGKQTVAANATRHALSGAHVIIPGEDPAEYDALRASLRSDLSPTGETERFLVDQIAQSQWKLMRIAKMETRLFLPSKDLVALLPPGTDPINISAHIFYQDADAAQSILKLSRYESAARRAYNQSLKQLLQLQALRRKLAQTPAPQPDTRNCKTNPIPPPESPEIQESLTEFLPHGTLPWPEKLFPAQNPLRS